MWLVQLAGLKQHTTAVEAEVLRLGSEVEQAQARITFLAQHPTGSSALSSPQVSAAQRMSCNSSFPDGLLHANFLTVSSLMGVQAAGCVASPAPSFWLSILTRAEVPPMQAERGTISQAHAGSWDGSEEIGWPRGGRQRFCYA